MHILDDYIVLKRENLETVSTVKSKDWLFKKNLFSFIIAGCILVTAVSLSLLTVYEIKHFRHIQFLEKMHEYEVNVHLAANDSLQSELDETVRANTLADKCYESVVEKCPPITHDRLWEFILECDPWYPDIIMTQAVQESGCGKSAVGRRCCNLFGMKKPSSRSWRCDSNRHNKKEQYAEYENWKLSVIDRILWEKWMFRNHKGKPDLDKYLEAISKVYNTETPGYAETIYKNASKYRKMIE